MSSKRGELRLDKGKRISLKGHLHDVFLAHFYHPTVTLPTLVKEAWKNGFSYKSSHFFEDYVLPTVVNDLGCKDAVKPQSTAKKVSDSPSEMSLTKLSLARKSLVSDTLAED